MHIYNLFVIKLNMDYLNRILTSSNVNIIAHHDSHEL